MMRFVEAAIEGLESLSPEMIEAELPDDSGGKYSLDDLPDDSGEMANLGLSPEERAQFQQESGWSDQIMDSLRSPEEYRIYENAGLQEREVNGRRCLVRDDIDLEQVDEDGFTNADLMSRGRSPLAPNGEKIELHHIGQRQDSPLAELSQTEHRGPANNTILHPEREDSRIDRPLADIERREHWETRFNAERGNL